MISAITATSGVIMAVRHRKYTLEAVQYHPESIMSECGDDLLQNFLSYKGGTWDENPDSCVLDPTLPPFPLEALLANATLPKEITEKVPSILEKIYAQRLTDVQLAKATPGTTPADISTFLSLHLAPPLISFVSRIKDHPSSSLALMAEIKRASPSKGSIALTASAPSQALLYALSGASVISVLTEPHFFKGLLSDLSTARAAIAHLPNRPAILRKDFILDEYQIAEARVNGADTVLLIVAMLPPPRLSALYAYSLSLGMEPLVEVNNASEMQTALDLGAKVIGVNNRNLHDFKVDMDTTTTLVDMVDGKDVVLCALSGISSRADVQRYTDQGVGAVLVGEALMRAPNTREFVAELLDIPPPPPPPPAAPPLVKICGIRTSEEALACASAGADMLGLIFVPSSKRYISLSTAQSISSAIRSHRASTTATITATITPDDADPTTNSRPIMPWFAYHASELQRRRRPLLVGVFQNQPLEDVLEAVNGAQLDLVQLHGNEPVEWARFIPVPVIKVLPVQQEKEKGVSQRSQAPAEVTRPGYHQFLLLDTIDSESGLSGGAGKTCDWDLARRVVQEGEVVVDTDLVGPLSTRKPEVGENLENTTDDDDGTPGAETAAAAATSTHHQHTLPIILAGGLTPENVRDAVDKVRPWAVDVSGGVETEERTGKDIDKVVRFVKEAKGIVLNV